MQPSSEKKGLRPNTDGWDSRPYLKKWRELTRRPPVQSVLPEEMDRRFVAVMQASVQRLLLVLVIVTIIIQTVSICVHGSWWPDRRNPIMGVGLALMACVAAVGGYRNHRLAERHCHELGLLCPHCRKALQRSGANLRRTGHCACCRQSILTHDETHQP